MLWIIKCVYFARLNRDTIWLAIDVLWFSGCWLGILGNRVITNRWGFSLLELLFPCLTLLQGIQRGFVGRMSNWRSERDLLALFGCDSTFCLIIITRYLTMILALGSLPVSPYISLLYLGTSFALSSEERKFQQRLIAPRHPNDSPLILHSYICM